MVSKAKQFRKLIKVFKPGGACMGECVCNVNTPEPFLLDCVQAGHSKCRGYTKDNLISSKCFLRAKNSKC